MDLLVLRRLANELDARLRGARIDQVYGIGRDHLAIVLGTSGAPRLWFSTEPELPHLYERRGPHETPRRPPPFAMAARKLLSGRRLRSVRCLGGDRVVEIAFEGDGAPRLIFEVIPRRATASIVDEGEIVRAVWRQRRSRPRAGEPYEPLPADARPPVTALGESDWEALRAGAPDRERLARSLLRSCSGMSLLLAREIATLHDGGVPLPRAVATELERAAAEPSEPRIYSPAPLAELREWPAPAGVVLAPYRLRHLEEGGPAARPQSFATLADAADAFFPLRAELLAHGAARRDLELDLDLATAKLRRALDAVADDLDGAGEPDDYRRLADLLLAHPAAERDPESVEVPDDYAEGRPVRITLDPALSLIDNAQRYYSRARRAERGRERTAARRRRLTGEISAIEELRTENGQAAAIHEIEQLARRARRHGVTLRAEAWRHPEARLQVPGEAQALDAGARANSESEATATPASAGDAVRAPAGASTSRGGAAKPSRTSGAGRRLETGIRAFTSSDGHQILVGRNAAGNERLTHRTARPDDFWLHAEGPGSHVVIRNPERDAEPSPDALREAASLAAHFSSSRGATKVNVRWTQVRHLRKPRGGSPGQVILRTARTFLAAPLAPEELFASPDEA